MSIDESSIDIETDEVESSLDNDDQLEKSVFDLNLSESDQSGDTSESDNVSSIDEEDEKILNTLPLHLRRVAKKAYLGEKNETSDEEGDFSDDEEWEKFKKSNWGVKKKNYYDGDTGDLEIGQEFKDAEEEEGTALEQLKMNYEKMILSDFDTNFSGELDSPSKSGVNFSGVEKIGAKGSACGEMFASIEGIKKKLDGFGKNEKLAFLMRDSPELPNLLEVVGSLLVELNKFDQLAGSVTSDIGASSDGIAYLQIKRQFILGLLQNVCFYVYLKAKGHPNSKSHPVLEKILKFQYLAQKMNKIDEKLKGQIDLLVAALEAGIDLKIEDSDPKSTFLNEAVENKNLNESIEKKKQKPIFNNEMKSKHFLEAEEAKYMKSLDNEKNEKTKKENSRTNKEISDFGDLSESELKSSIQSFKKRKSQNGKKIALEEKEERLDDIPAEALEYFENFEKEQTKRKKTAKGNKNLDSFGRAVLQRREETKKLKESKYKVEPRISGLLEAELEAERLRRAKGNKTRPKRAVSYEIMKNRGLTPHRKKINRNPRVKKRDAFRKAKIRRKGQVREVRTGEVGRYEGEATGVRTTIVRGRKLG